MGDGIFVSTPKNGWLECKFVEKLMNSFDAPSWPCLFL